MSYFSPRNQGVSTVASDLTKKPKVKKGPQWKAKFSKEQILEMRTRHEFEGWNTAQIREHYGLDANEAYRYLQYITAVNLIPKRPSPKPSSGLTK
ncbi:hypothetical protein [Acinetobacter sp.]|uniref:hypothetical protein n=1 Tax=Acinetobacter sp. TaxID=472 RepID=UPI00388F4AC3